MSPGLTGVGVEAFAIHFTIAGGSSVPNPQARQDRIDAWEPHG